MEVRGQRNTIRMAHDEDRRRLTLNRFDVVAPKGKSTKRELLKLLEMRCKFFA